MDRAQQRRLALRELGRRRVGRVTWAVAVAGTALAAVFGVAFARSTAAAQSVAPSTDSGADSGSNGGGGSEFSPNVPSAPDLQSPYEVPQPRYGGGRGARSSPTS